MDFALSDEQQMLRAASRDLLTDHCPPADVRAWLEKDEGSAQLWAFGSQLGWPGLAVPEAHGGSGQGLVELALVAEELGRANAPGALLPTVLTSAAVARGGSEELQAELLPALAEGKVTASWAAAEPGQTWAPAGVRTTATVAGDDLVLTGGKTLVQDAQEARWLLVTALLDDTLACVIVDADSPGITIRRQQVLDLTRAFHEVRLDAVRVPTSRRLDLDARQLQRLYDDGAVLTAADALGAGNRLLAMTVDYAKVRHQFGRAIGSFQAIKHKLATMRIQVQAAHAATYYAAMAADAGDPDAERATCVAKAYTSQAMSSLAGEALQIHGGIGFTWEHDLHLYLRRVKVDALLYGDAALHHERLCALLEQGRSSAS